MKILIPKNFEKERTYIVNTIISDFLGLNFDLEISDIDNYKILLSNGKIIVINDTFWGNISNKTSFLHFENIPASIKFTSNHFLTENDIPIIYGNEKIEVTDNQIYCGIDIFASSFFMLSRWEEYVSVKLDKHFRFIDSNSLAQRFNFHKRPIVNEYVEMLWNMLENLGIDQCRKIRNFRITPTHDIDFLLYFKPRFQFFKSLIGDLLKRRNFKRFAYNLKLFFTSTKDAFDTFDYLMKISDKYHLKSIFNFIAGTNGETDVHYNFNHKRTKKIINKIIQRKHIVGIHGSYDSYNNSAIFQKEMQRFSNFGLQPVYSRQHFLRLQIPETWQILEQTGITFDSTLGYSNSVGFRAGTCYEFRIFDIIERKTLDLIEFPLIAMDTAVFNNINDKSKIISYFSEIKKIVQKYNGNFVFLWHNSNFKSYEWHKLSDDYEKIFV